MRTCAHSVRCSDLKLKTCTCPHSTRTRHLTAFAIDGVRSAVVAILVAFLTTSTLSVSGSSGDEDSWGGRPRLEPTSWVPDVPTCEVVMKRFTATPPVSSSPPRDMPPDLVRRFTADGAIAMGDFFVDDTIGGKGSHYQYPAGDINEMVKSAAGFIDGTRSVARLPEMDRWIIDALRKHAPQVKGKTVAVWGSMSPWYEAIAVAAGAARVTTIEYNKLTYEHPLMEQVTPRNLEAKLPTGGFDVAMSISSFDHDGLGRYGDPVHPDGDLLAMAAARCVMQPGGLLFLTVPVGPDVVVWNLHRRYGRVRLPLLLRGWEVVDVVGWSWRRFDTPVDYRRSYEPVFVLRVPNNDATSVPYDDGGVDKSDL